MSVLWQHQWLLLSPLQQDLCGGINMLCCRRLSLKGFSSLSSHVHVRQIGLPSFPEETGVNSWKCLPC